MQQKYNTGGDATDRSLSVSKDSHTVYTAGINTVSAQSQGREPATITYSKGITGFTRPTGVDPNVEIRVRMV